MGVRETDADAEGTGLSKEMRASLDRTGAALKRMWEREEHEARTVYEIAIPAQTLTILGREHADHILRTLKAAKVTGSYRMTRR